MDISLKHEDYKLLVVNNDNCVEENLSAEIILPEYMPEILHIIKSVAQPRVASCKLVGERVTVEGSCELRLIYTGEDGCIYSFSQNKPFTAFKENESFANAVDVNTTVKASFVNCRATGTKRAEIKAGIGIRFNVSFFEAKDIISVENCHLEEKSVELKVFSAGCRKTRAFAMSDTVSLSVPSAFVLGCNATSRLDEVRKISNKIMLRGEAVVDICYVNSDNRAQTQSLSHSIPLNQIIELEGFEETFVGDINIEVSAIEVIPKGEHDTFATAFDISLGLEACVTMWQERDLKIITDVYSVEGAVALKKSPYTFHSPLDKIDDKFLCENSFTVAGEEVTQILQTQGEITGVKVKWEDGVATVSGSLCVSVIFRDIAGTVSNVNKVFDFSYKHSVSCKSEDVMCDPSVKIDGITANITAANTVSVKAELRVCGTLLEKITIDTITDITVAENSSKGRRMPITIYFPCENGECLWDIAKRYNTTVSAIAEENGISGDTTENLKILFIPSA